MEQMDEKFSVFVALHVKGRQGLSTDRQARTFWEFKFWTNRPAHSLLSSETDTWVFDRQHILRTMPLPMHLFEHLHWFLLPAFYPP